MYRAVVGKYQLSPIYYIYIGLFRQIIDDQTNKNLISRFLSPISDDVTFDQISVKNELPKCLCLLLIQIYSSRFSLDRHRQIKRESVKVRIKKYNHFRYLYLHTIVPLSSDHFFDVWFAKPNGNCCTSIIQ